MENITNDLTPFYISNAKGPPGRKVCLRGAVNLRARVEGVSFPGPRIWINRAHKPYFVCVLRKVERDVCEPLPMIRVFSKCLVRALNNITSDGFETEL